MKRQAIRVFVRTHAMSLMTTCAYLLCSSCAWEKNPWQDRSYASSIHQIEEYEKLSLESGQPNRAYRSIFYKVKDFPILPGAKISHRDRALKSGDAVIVMYTQKQIDQIADFYISKMQDLGCAEVSNFREITHRKLDLAYRCVRGFDTDVIINASDQAYSSSDDQRWIQVHFHVQR